MTIDEAIKNREECLKYLEGIGRKASPECVEAVRWSVKALKALHPVSREKVERVWRGEWISTGAISCKCSKCNHLELKSRAVDEYNFCPYCMAPMTEEAVEMVMERLEALKDGKGD